MDMRVAAAIATDQTASVLAKSKEMLGHMINAAVPAQYTVLQPLHAKRCTQYTPNVLQSIRQTSHSIRQTYTIWAKHLSRSMRQTYLKQFKPMTLTKYAPNILQVVCRNTNCYRYTRNALHTVFAKCITRNTVCAKHYTQVRNTSSSTRPTWSMLYALLCYTQDLQVLFSF